MQGEKPTGKIRLAELLAALSLGIDLGFAQPMEHVLRQCLIALRLSEQLGLDAPGRSAAYFTSLLISVGCHSDAHEQAKWFGDDIAVKANKYEHGMNFRAAAASMRMLGAGRPPLHRFRVGLEFVVSGHKEMDVTSHALLARALGEHLGLPAAVLDGLASAYEKWDGRGWPGERSRERIPLPARIAQMAEFVEVAHRVGGIASATAFARKQRGRQFDPALVDLLCARSDAILGGLDAVQTWEAVIDAEPALAIVLADEELDAALLAVANFVDLKSPYSLGHSGNVGELAAGAAMVLKLPSSDVTTMRRAGLVHDFGRLGISNAIWDKRGQLGAGEWERVRMQPFITERMLRQSPALAPLGTLAAQHRERLDGSGYPRGISGSAISQGARILGAADAYQAMREQRPHRAARSPGDAAAELRAEAHAGRLDGDAVEAVLNAAGHRMQRRPSRPAGLTAREVEVLKLLALGSSNKEIAQRLLMSRKTAGNHVEHIYAKIGATNRAAASLFAVHHGLLASDDALDDSKKSTTLG
jgi:HD-GYP domain-containing protein (c-di-GMP phosphodiesterase class II)